MTEDDFASGRVQTLLERLPATRTHPDVHWGQAKPDTYSYLATLASTIRVLITWDPYFRLGVKPYLRHSLSIKTQEAHWDRSFRLPVTDFSIHEVDILLCLLSSNKYRDATHKDLERLLRKTWSYCLSLIAE